MRKIGVLAMALALVGLMAGGAAAHELIIKPAQAQPEVGAKLPFSVVSAHVFMVSEEMEPLKNVKASLHGPGGASEVKLSPNPVLMTLDGAVELQDPGTYTIAAVRQGVIWSQTTSGMKEGGRDTLEGVIESRLYEKFCKTLLTVGQADQSWQKPLGHGLEIVPVSDPTGARAGDELVFKILNDGQPAGGEVTATYDGFTTQPNTYAYFTETYGEGLAKVKVHAPGLWMVRVQQVSKAPQGQPYEKIVRRAVLAFVVK